MIQIILLYTLYGIVFILGKQALLFSKPIFLTGIRMLVAGIFSFILYRLWYHRISWSSITRYQAWYILLLGVFNVYLTNANESWSLQYLSTGKVAFIYNLSPFFSLIFCRFMFKEPITWQKVIGMVIAAISITPLLVENSNMDIIDSTLKFGPISLAEVIMIIAAAATAYGWVIMKYLMEQRSDFNSYFLNAVSFMIGGILCCVQAYYTESPPYVVAGYAGSFAFYMMSMMTIQNLVAYNFNAYVLKTHSPTLVILFSFVMPIITGVLGYLMLSEPLSAQFLICSAGVAIGLLIFYQEELAQEKQGLLS